MTRRAEHDELEPKRLLDERATPDALRDALQALRDRAPTPAAAARMRERVASPVAPASRAPGVLFACTMLALIGALAWWAWPRREPAGAPRAAAPSEAPRMPMPAAHEAPESTGALRGARAAHGDEPPVQPEAAAPQPAARPSAVAAALPAPAATLEDAPAPKRARERLAPKASTAPPQAVDAVDPDPAAVAPEAIDKPALKPKPKPQGDDAERMFADPQDEAGLLYRARRLASSDPKAALRLLVLHEASFPDGAFVQERDMLEIQIHERLGQAATAKRLAALFKQRYPDSVYRVSP